MSEDRDYTGLLDFAPPEGLQDWAKQFCTSEYLIYREGRGREALTGMSFKRADAVCTACGKRMSFEKVSAGCSRSYASAPFGIGYYEGGEYVQKISGDGMKCQECGADVKLKHAGNISYGDFDYVFPMSVGRCEDRLVLYVWRVSKSFLRDGRVFYDTRPWEAMVVEEKKLIRLSNWVQTFYAVSFRGCWQQTKSFKDTIKDVDLVYPWDAALLEGSTAEHSKLDLYLEVPGPRFPAAYLRLWQRHPNAENLLVQGAGALLGGLIAREKAQNTGYKYGYNNYIPKLPEIDWKQRRPSAMLHMNAGEFRLCAGKMTAEDYLLFQASRAGGAPFALPADLGLAKKSVRREHEGELQKLCAVAKHGASPRRAAEYIAKQKKRYPESHAGLTELVDYWDMAADEGLELRTPEARWPMHLEQAHDQLLLRKKFKEQEALRAKFRARYMKLQRLSFERDGICIFPPKSESELICEGKVLQHCVAGYAERHATGQTAILFVRHIDAPDVPWYTLNLDEKGGRVIQNRGKGNCARTPEVRAFEAAWIAWVRAGAKRNQDGTPAVPEDEQNKLEVAV